VKHSSLSSRSAEVSVRSAAVRARRIPGLPIVKSHTFDPLALRRAFGSFATGVTIITAIDDAGAPVGMTANSFGSISLDPPLVQWSLRINSGLHPVFVRAERFAVSVLRSDQESLARRFASRVADRFAGVDLVIASGGGDSPPLIADAIAHFQCRKVNDIRVGDHELFIGQVLSVETRPGAPLLFFRSQFQTA
jgi:flavin reductase (DIM6/NTAB) family NADH-FMN oxidoreductase RutF